MEYLSRDVFQTVCVGITEICDVCDFRDAFRTACITEIRDATDFCCANTCRLKCVTEFRTGRVYGCGIVGTKIVFKEDNCRRGRHLQSPTRTKCCRWLR